MAMLPCPECKLRGLPGRGRIGNNRGRDCRTCNNWAKNVERLTMGEIRRREPELFLECRDKVEKNLYPQVYEEWVILNPDSGPRIERKTEHPGSRRWVAST